MVYYFCLHLSHPHQCSFLFNLANVIIEHSLWIRHNHCARGCCVERLHSRGWSSYWKPSNPNRTLCGLECKHATGYLVPSWTTSTLLCDLTTSSPRLHAVHHLSSEKGEALGRSDDKFQDTQVGRMTGIHPRTSSHICVLSLHAPGGSPQTQFKYVFTLNPGGADM